MYETKQMITIFTKVQRYRKELEKIPQIYNKKYM